MTEHYDAICVGVGGVGSAALAHMSARGLRVLGIDRFRPGHDRGSSHGESRIIRLVYMEHPDYVPLLRRSYELWDQLSEKMDHPLLHYTGILYAGPRAGGVIPALETCALQHGLPLERFSAADAERRFPGFRVPEDWEAAFEIDAGYLEVEACVLAYVRQAHRAGAEFRLEETVLDWQASSAGVEVRTDKGSYSAKRMVLCPGAWAADLVRTPNIPFRVLRKELAWYAAPEERHTRAGGCPLFFFETPDGSYYGFPDLGGNGLKVAEHTGGEPVSNPLEVDRTPKETDRRRVESFLESHLPGVSRQRLRNEVCLYTMSPDEHFVVDRHPEHDTVFFVAGLSGHGFKFASVLGEVAAEWAVSGNVPASVAFLRSDRFPTG